MWRNRRTDAWTRDGWVDRGLDGQTSAKTGRVIIEASMSDKWHSLYAAKCIAALHFKSSDDPNLAAP